MLNILLGLVIIIGGIGAIIYTSYRITRGIIYGTIRTGQKMKYKFRKTGRKA
jgi:hypothetical protein